MNAEEFVLSHVQRRETANAFHALARRRGWDVFAANVRTNHAHILTRVSGDPRRAMAAFKAAATHRMRELSLISPDVRPWSRGGSLRFLFDDLAVASACRYVLEEQGVDLGGTLVSDLDQASGNSSWE